MIGKIIEGENNPFIFQGILIVSAIILVGIFVILLGFYFLLLPMEIYTTNEGLSFGGPFSFIMFLLFPKKILWKEIVSIKTKISLGIIRLSIMFGKENKWRFITNRYNIVVGIVEGYRELLEEVVKNATNAEIDNKTKELLQGNLRNAEIFSLKLIRISCLIILSVFIFLFVDFLLKCF
ncbi:MAG: hypothetical protein AB1297_09650 [bacterium]